MAFQKSLCLFLVFFATIVFSSNAYKYSVGGKDGWVLNPSENYNQWAQRMRFLINDTLSFKYKKGSNSVLVVSKDDYDNCKTENPIMKMEDGDSVFKFDRSGPFYFISGNNGNCEKGQKLIVVVLAMKKQLKPPSSPTPAPIARAPAPVSQTPAAAPPIGSSPTSLSPLPAAPVPVIAPVSPSPALVGQIPAMSPKSPSPSISPMSPSPGIHSPVISPAPAMSPWSPSPVVSLTPAITPLSPSPMASSPKSPSPSISPMSPSPGIHSPVISPVPATSPLSPSPVVSPTPAITPLSPSPIASLPPSSETPGSLPPSTLSPSGENGPAGNTPADIRTPAPAGSSAPPFFPSVLLVSAVSFLSSVALGSFINPVI